MRELSIIKLRLQNKMTLQTTDVLLIVTVILLICATGINMKGGTRTCPVPCPTYIPRPCGSSGFTSVRSDEGYVSGMTYDDDFTDVDELTNHTRGRGLVPRVEQPQHTKNLWKAFSSQPDYDFLGRRHTYFSSDLLTPYKDQNKLRSVDPYLREVKPAPMGSSLFEDFAVHPYTDEIESDNPLENERNPTIKKMLM